eukprot:CAMPEP_0204572446 /NCGR_PEP_ID=MMETSP0661-20131031/39465_1 /ASSEMBLY_ACC=CAM_ASM_000606 /TAXON_ID=109239 /ORGANISM="Alexandrium margalefi, Strain AMGDE01CS-322" /LENGTH=94 /DNA_ID=CAMNT_0051580797 /DNA_START=124 /DNA_END=408 /DNA_ORIENTATION=-
MLQTTRAVLPGSPNAGKNGAQEQQLRQEVPNEPFGGTPEDHLLATMQVPIANMGSPREHDARGGGHARVPVVGEARYLALVSGDKAVDARRFAL